MLVPRLTKLLILFKAHHYSSFLRRNSKIFTNYEQDKDIEKDPKDTNRTEQDPKDRIEPKEYKQNAKPKNRTRTDQNPQKINKHWKLPNTPTTMPRNTAAGKAAAGPANTSNGETVAVSTPQEELAAANAEIERL